MIEFPYYVFFAMAFICSVGNWRLGLFLCIIFDIIRDPVRKLAENQPIGITVSASALWFAVFVGAFASYGPRLFSVVRQFRSLGTSVTLLMLAIIPAALVSVISFQEGWKIAGIGFASYTLPVMGVIVGFHFIRRTDDLWRLLGFYCIVNGIALLGTLLEFLKFDLPALGGLKMVWLRYQADYVVELICGYYRSPDVMGLHAANITMFGFLLSMQPKSRYRLLWSSLLTWGSFCLLLSGRRKMIGMILVFVIVYLIARLHRSGINRIFSFTALSLLVALAFFLLMHEVEDTRDYITYAQTTVTQGTERFNRNVIGGVIVTIQQSGIFGYGLGTVTQGSRYAETRLGIRNWQEDGISRVFAEMGIPGALLVAISIGYIVRVCYLAFKMVPEWSPIREIQIGLGAVIAASAASFIVSHQAFSGDPCALLFVSLLLGILLSGPIQVVRQNIAAQRIAELFEEAESEQQPVQR